jgi:superfamily II RNA helicase
MTGDIKVNPNADVLIMTTEILMNSLFSLNTTDTTTTLQFQMDIQKELGCVIFDEVHYINDKDRGHVWEQSILMLPSHIQMILLSATIDNPTGFAEWIENRESESNKSVCLISTNHRVVPLTHYGFFATTEVPFKTIKDKAKQQEIRESTNKLILLRNPIGQFNDIGYHTLGKMRHEFDKHRFFMKRKFVLNKLAEFLKNEEMLPAIVFVFSRKNVEVYAKEITTGLLEDDSKIPYTTRDECDKIIKKFPNYKEYLELPEYLDLVSLLEKGIGIHHSGMISVLREIVEIMISQKRIKMLFATESFAIGLDCPIKTAVFSSLTKFDGSNMRHVMPHEYTQMAGRAGRRGIDTIGHVVHCNNLFDLPDMNDYKNILCGKPQQLVSKFKISYSIILNLLKNGRTHEFHEFVDRTMLKKEMDHSVECVKQNVNTKKISYMKKESNIDSLRTPLEVCRQYIHDEDMLYMYNAKKKKEALRKMGLIEDEYKWLKQDIKFLKDYDTLKKNMENEENEIELIQNFSKTQICDLCKILENGFIERDCESNCYTFTTIGRIAANINEAHPLIIAHIVCKTNWFESFSIEDYLELLSVFSNLRVQDDFKRHSIEGDIYQYMEEIAVDFEKREFEKGLETGYQYNTIYNYDLTEEIRRWVNCNTEEECKQLLQHMYNEREITIGEFTKAILKISALNNEIMGVCEISGEVALGLLHKIKDVNGLILKYIATTQSLYV